MIKCPNCKAEIEEDSNFCDQCGQELFFCEQCGKVGKGRRCIYCGGMMLRLDERRSKAEQFMMISRGARSIDPVSHSYTASYISQNTSKPVSSPVRPADMTASQKMNVMPQLQLINSEQNIHLVGYNGAVIGRREGVYAKHFQGAMYVSGIHAQLMYSAQSGWCVLDKHSSNGTFVNGARLEPDVARPLHDGDTVAFANMRFVARII